MRNAISTLIAVGALILFCIGFVIGGVDGNKVDAAYYMLSSTAMAFFACHGFTEPSEESIGGIMRKVLAFVVVATWIAGIAVGAISTDFLTAKIGWFLLCFPAGVGAGFIMQRS